MSKPKTSLYDVHRSIPILLESFRVDAFTYLLLCYLYELRPASAFNQSFPSRLAEFLHSAALSAVASLILSDIPPHTK